LVNPDFVSDAGRIALAQITQRERLARGRAELAARRSLAGSGELLHLEVDLNSQVNRSGFTVEDRGFIFSLQNSFEGCRDE
jgi:hypothetical protein